MDMSLGQQDDRGNPIDLLEEVVSANDWPFDRFSDSELMVQISGDWCGYSMCFVWQADVYAVQFSCRFEHKVPPTKLAQVHHLLSAVNETLWLGHFEIASGEGVPIFRHTVPMRGLRNASVELFEDLLDTALLECERFYPALQLVLWGGRPVPEALQTVALEPQGEA